MNRLIKGLMLLVATVCATQAETDFPSQTGDPSVLLVKRKKGREAEVREFHKARGCKVTRFRHIAWDSVEVPRGHHGKELCQRYKDSPLFEAVCFQRTYTVDATPNDPLFSQQWDLLKIAAPAAWDKATSNNVVVAVIDTGIDYTHSDLVANLWTGPQGEHGYTASGGVISNGGGDDHFHGTHVAGTIAAVGNNGVGVVGVNWRAKVVSFKFLGASGSGSSVDAILCIEKMIDLRQAGVNIRVSNNSWGTFGVADDPALEDAFREAENNGILNICASGNNGVDIDEFGFSPAGLPVDGIVSVLASGEDDEKAYFSNFGAIGTDILAPGVNILNCKLNGGYWSLSGTSMASPHVAGAMAMVFSFNPSLTPQQAKTILLQPTSYDRTPFTVNTTGGGRLNLNKLWNNPAIGNPGPANHPPVATVSPPTNVVIVPAAQTVAITVSATDPDGDAVNYSYNWDTHRWPWFFKFIVGGGSGLAATNFSGSGVTNVFAATGKDLALDQNVRIRFAVNDGHGGGAGARVSAFTYRNEVRVQNLEGAIRGFRIWDVPGDSNPWFRLDMDPNYPGIGGVRFDLKVYGDEASGGGVGSPCCHPPNQDIRASWNGFSKGSYNVRALVMDSVGNFATSPSSIYFVSNSTVRPPQLRMTTTTNRGVAPLTVRADLSATLRGDATRLHYGVLFLDSSGVNTDIFNPVRTFTLTEPGIYAMQFTASDLNQPLWDTVVKVFTVLPAWPARLTLSRLANAVSISWTAGILQEASQVAGPFTDSSNQNNPQTRPASGAARFFRVR